MKNNFWIYHSLPKKNRVSYLHNPSLDHLNSFCRAPRIKPYLSLHAEAEAPDDLTVEEDEEAMPTETGKAIELENNLMMEAGPTSPSLGSSKKEEKCHGFLWFYTFLLLLA